MDRPNYNKASKALQEAFDACYNHPDRDILGMSHGPFSGVNVALGIIASLEKENLALKDILHKLIRTSSPNKGKNMNEITNTEAPQQDAVVDTKYFAYDADGNRIEITAKQFGAATETEEVIVTEEGTVADAADVTIH